MKTKVLITGITGFVGSHLADYLLENHADTVDVYGIKRWRSPKENIEHCIEKLKLYDADLRDLSSLLKVLGEVKPDMIFHLAAQSYVLTSYVAPVDTMDNNVLGTTNLLEAIHILKQDPLIHVCSSSEVYGQVRPEDVPITEDCPFRPASPYAASKCGEDMVALMYGIAYKQRIIRTRMFTHTGPRRGEVFALSAFTKQIARIEKGKQEPVMLVGNLDSVRTWADVRDTVRAYWLMMQKCPAGEVYNIGGNVTMTIREMLDNLLKMTTYKGKIEVRVDPKLLRPADVTLQIPSIEKFKKVTGWEPKISFEQTMRETLEYWRIHA